VWLRCIRAGTNGSRSSTGLISHPLDYIRFLDDGRVCLTNNAAERALRGVAVRRIKLSPVQTLAAIVPLPSLLDRVLLKPLAADHRACLGSRPDAYDRHGRLCARRRRASLSLPRSSRHSDAARVVCIPEWHRRGCHPFSSPKRERTETASEYSTSSRAVPKFLGTAQASFVPWRQIMQARHAVSRHDGSHVKFRKSAAKLLALAPPTYGSGL
jgi:Transposase IS66 family